MRFHEFLSDNRYQTTQSHLVTDTLRFYFTVQIAQVGQKLQEILVDGKIPCTFIAKTSRTRWMNSPMNTPMFVSPGDTVASISDAIESLRKYPMWPINLTAVCTTVAPAPAPAIFDALANWPQTELCDTKFIHFIMTTPLSGAILKKNKAHWLKTDKNICYLLIMACPKRCFWLVTPNIATVSKPPGCYVRCWTLKTMSTACLFSRDSAQELCRTQMTSYLSLLKSMKPLMLFALVCGWLSGDDWRRNMGYENSLRM